MVTTSSVGPSSYFESFPVSSAMAITAHHRASPESLGAYRAVMNALHIKHADILHGDEMIIDLSDGRTIVLSLKKLLTLTPDSVTTEGEETAEDA